MKHISIPKIGFGILTALMLAFGVPGTAEALTLDHRSGGGNYRTVFPGDPFTISFSVRLAGSATPKPGHSSVSGQTDYSYYTEGTNVQSGYQSGNETFGNPSTTATTDDVLVSAAAAVYYNDEALAINIPDGFILRKGSARVPAQSGTSRLTERTTDTATLGDFSLHEAAADTNLRLGATITLSGTASNTAGSHSITITDVTPESDFPAINPAPTSGTSLTFTIYVVPRVHQLDSPATALASGSDSVYYGYKDAEHQVNTAFAFTPTANAPVYYSVQGSGSLHVGEDNSNPKLPLSNGTLTSSSASVYLRGHTATSRVTASVGGTTPHTVIYIYIDPSNVARYPRLEITNETNQSGASGGQLEDYLEVKVTDGRGSPVSGVAVEFTTTASDSMFIPVPGTRVYGTAAALAAAVSDPVNGMVFPATSTVPPKKASPVFVQTDRSGLAKVYYELGTETTQTITANLVGVPPSPYVSKSFTATLGGTGSTRVANLEIVSGNPQRAAKAKQLDAPLVVIARSTAGFRIPNVVIQFRTNTGILSRHGLTQKPSEGSNSGQVPTGTLNPDTGQQIYVVTGSNGQASVDYNIGQIVVAREVVAEVRHESRDSDYSFAIDRVVFNVNGSGSQQQQNQNQNQNNQNNQIAAVVLSSVTGSAGGTATLRITAPANAVVTVGNALRETQGLDTFPRANASAPTRSGTTVTSRLTLPSQVDTYPLTVTVGGTEYRVSVVVTAAAAGQSSGRLTVSVDPFSGAPGSTATVRVSATDADGDPANITVRLSATNGVLSASSVETGTEGTDDSIRIVRGSTAGTENYVTVNGPSGYESVRGRFIIAAPASGMGVSAQDTDTGTGGTQTTSTVSGSPSSIEIEGSPRIDGRLAQALRLRARVLDANDRGVSGVGVTFRVIAPGQGAFAGARGSGRAIRIETDGSGDVSTNFTPTRATSTGTITVEAKAAGVSASVSFIIDV
ncbi:hypothetical protein F4X88_04790, partial [Candidatus Poribacteria bacterium]|nr:hypothetical protein [Candidatus Poribacteria bacterium]